MNCNGKCYHWTLHTLTKELQTLRSRTRSAHACTCSSFTPPCQSTCTAETPCLNQELKTKTLPDNPWCPQHHWARHRMRHRPGTSRSGAYIYSLGCMLRFFCSRTGMQANGSLKHSLLNSICRQLDMHSCTGHCDFCS